MEMKQLINCQSFLGYIILLIITKHSEALTGLCQTEIGRATCFACSDMSYPMSKLAKEPRDCCGDPYVYSACERCLFDPESCQEKSENDADNFSSELAQVLENDPKSKEELLQIIHASPERRSKYFLGKRGNTRAFLGKRGSTRAFLGKRSDPNDAPSESNLHSSLMEEVQNMGQLLSKRPNPFLGKRFGDFLPDLNDDISYFDDETKDSIASDLEDKEKRSNPFLGKRSNPFLGKRDAMDSSVEDDLFKRGRPFLGKRDSVISPDENDFYKRGRPFLGKRDMLETSPIEDDLFKRGRPFLGKRGSQYFLGKRVGSNQPTMEELKNLYMRPLARRAKYFLGKRSEGENSLLSKRQKYFLGKRHSQDFSLIQDEHFVNSANDRPLSHEQNNDKRQKYFLGKRSVSDLTQKMKSSELEQ